MIISHKHRYVYVELPRTGTTAISAELEANYDGQQILSKHSHYSAFLKIASEEEKQYRVFSGIRNPLDDAVSEYLKYGYKSYERSHSRYQRNRRKKFLGLQNQDFGTYLKMFYRVPYDNWSCVHHHRFNHIIRFEHLQEDFSKMLEIIGVEQVRPLPKKNTTRRKSDPLEYYTPANGRRTVWIFGPYMRKWGYELPDHFPDKRIPLSSRVLFAVLRPFRSFYWTHFRQPGARNTLVSRLLIGSKRLTAHTR